MSLVVPNGDDCIRTDPGPGLDLRRRTVEAADPGIGRGHGPVHLVGIGVVPRLVKVVRDLGQTVGQRSAGIGAQTTTRTDGGILINLQVSLFEREVNEELVKLTLLCFILPEERRIVYVGRLENELTKEELRSKFISYGTIRMVTLHEKTNG